MAFVPIGNIKGQKGDSIESIAKTATNGIVDTYTVTLDNGSTYTFTVTNGVTPIKGVDYFDGSVTSVAGRVGDVLLATTDISGLNTSLATKQALLVSGTNIKTINGESLLGGGDFELQAGANVTNVVVASGETISVDTFNTSTVGGLNVSVVEEDLSPIETVQTYSFNADNPYGIDSKNYRLLDSLTLTDTTATLSTLTWDSAVVNMMIYENGGRGKASIHSINNEVASITVLQPFSKLIFNSGEWSVYGFNIDDGTLSLSSSFSDNSLSNITKLEGCEFTSNDTKPVIVLDTYGFIHIMVQTFGTPYTLSYITNVSGVFVRENNILDTNNAAKALYNQVYHDMKVDSTGVVHVAFCSSYSSGINRIRYGTRLTSGEWVEDTSISTVVASYAGSKYEIVITDTNFNIMANESDNLIFYTKNGGSFIRTSVFALSSQHFCNVILGTAGAFEFYLAKRTVGTIRPIVYDGAGVFTSKGLITLNETALINSLDVHKTIDNKRVISVIGYSSDCTIIYIYRTIYDTTTLLGNTTAKTLTKYASYTATSPQQGAYDAFIVSYGTDNTLFAWYDQWCTLHILRNENNVFIDEFSTAAFGDSIFMLRDAGYYSNQNLYSPCVVHPEFGVSFLASNYGNSYGMLMCGLESFKDFNETTIAKTNASYNAKDIYYMEASAVDDNGFFHVFFRSPHNSYGTQLSHYLTNSGGSLSFTWNFMGTSIDATSPAINCVRFANGIVYALEESSNNVVIWKKINGTWTKFSYVSTGLYFGRTQMGVNSNMMSVVNDSSNETIEVLGWKLNGNSLYQPAKLTVYNGLSEVTYISSFAYAAASWEYYNNGAFKTMGGKYIFVNGKDKKIISNLSGSFIETSYSTVIGTLTTTQHVAYAENKNGDVFVFLKQYVGGSPDKRKIAVVKLLQNGTNSQWWLPYCNYIDDQGFNVLQDYAKDKAYIVGNIGATSGSYHAYSVSIVEVGLDDFATGYTKYIPIVSYPDNTYSFNAKTIFYNHIRKTFEAVEQDKTSVANIVYLERGINLVKYKINTPIHITLPVVFTKYWVELIAKSIQYSLNGQNLYPCFSYDGATFYVYKNGETAIRPIVSSSSLVHGGTDGVWYYNANTAYGSTTWTIATSKYDAFDVVFGIVANTMSALDFSSNPYLELDDTFYLHASISSANELYSPSLYAFSMAYYGMSKWVNKTQDYEIFSDSTEKVYVKNLSNETKNIKVVHNG